MEAEAPKNSAGLIARVRFEILVGAGIQEINQARVMSLSEMVQDFANQQMHIQLAPQGAQSAPGAPIQNGFRHTMRTT